VSETVSRGRQPGQQAGPPAAAQARGSRRRRRGGWAAAGLVAVLAAGAVAGWQAGVFSSAASPGAGRAAGAPAPATAAVRRLDIAATMPVAGTLGYAGSWTVTGHGGGRLTWLPSPGQVIRQGQALYRVDNGSPVVLVYGRVPDWRALAEGVRGADVAQLNHDLVRLGYASSAGVAALGWDYYSWQTRYAVQQLEERLGVSSPPGSLPWGRVVFEPEALRVSQVTGSLGGPASGPVLQVTSDRHVVTVPLDVSDQSEVHKGDAVTVTLPDGAATPGTVSAVGKVASVSGRQGATIPVQVTLTRPRAAGSLDQAPVTVNITTATARDALVVPVSALLARSPGRYVVEVAGAGNTRRWVPVRPGIFDDASGLVQVSGALRPGERVVVGGS
jgi:hypothetical protein